MFYAKSGKLVRERALLQNLGNTDTSQNSLDFEYFFQIHQHDAGDGASQVVTRVAEVQVAESLEDYRPARPEHFIGREDEQKKLLRLLERVRDQQGTTRVFAITGDSGMGKSSLIIKLAERLRNTRHRRKFFAYAVDVRAATGPSYLLWSLLASFRAAAQEGFGTQDASRLQISSPSDPLQSPSIQEFLQVLGQRQQVVCLILDQFEELYSKPELYPVFEATQRLLLSTSSVQANFVLGFAWKSDSTVQQEHPAYHMWHNLGDHRYEVQLLPFDLAEASKTVTLFEREFQHTLNKGLRRQLIENSRGLPWLLKKLCIHVFEQLRSSVSQSELAEKELDVKLLFDRDLNRLTQAETACLKSIAETAPADWFEALNLYGQEVVRALQNKRLVIRSGDRLNIYWDTFREYVLTREVPSVPMSYLPASPSIGSLLGVAELLSSSTWTTYADLSASTGLSQNTVGNVVRDLMMFGVCKSEGSRARLDSRLNEKDPEAILRSLRNALKRHALNIQLSKLKSGTTVPTDLIVQMLKRGSPAAQHRAQTWRIYADRMGLWLEAAGYLERQNEQFVRRDRGDVNFQAVGQRVKRGFGAVFLADTSPARAVEALTMINERESVSTAEVAAHGLRNAIAVLARLELVYRDGGVVVPTADHRQSRAPATELLRAAAAADTTLQDVASYLRDNPQSSAEAVGRWLEVKYGRTWTSSSCKRVGQGISHWARWTFSDIPQRQAPSRARREPGTHNASLFRRASPQACLALLEHFQQSREAMTASELRSLGFINATSVLFGLGILRMASSRYEIDSERGIGWHPESALREAAGDSPFLRSVAAFLTENHAASGPDVGRFLVREFQLDWAPRTAENSGTEVRRWALWLLERESSHVFPPSSKNAHRNNQEVLPFSD